MPHNGPLATTRVYSPRGVTPLRRPVADGRAALPDSESGRLLRSTSLERDGGRSHGHAAAACEIVLGVQPSKDARGRPVSRSPGTLTARDGLPGRTREAQGMWG